MWPVKATIFPTKKDGLPKKKILPKAAAARAFSFDAFHLLFPSASWFNHYISICTAWEKASWLGNTRPKNHGHDVQRSTLKQTWRHQQTSSNFRNVLIFADEFVKAFSVSRSCVIRFGKAGPLPVTHAPVLPQRAKELGSICTGFGTGASPGINDVY